MNYVHIYADASGETHIEDVVLALSPLPSDSPEAAIHLSAWRRADQLAFARCLPGTDGAWQTTPRRQFLFVLAGEVEIEVSDGTVRRVAAGATLLFEDRTGKGHCAGFLGTEQVILALVELPD